jgi:hypothetical protein
MSGGGALLAMSKLFFGSQEQVLAVLTESRLASFVTFPQIQFPIP